MKLITSLGTGKYKCTCYVWGDREHTCSFSPVASAGFLGASDILLFLTAEAREAQFNAFRDALPKDIAIKTMRVPKGQNQAELWKIFDQIAAAVEPGESVSFDVTHGFRSFPMIGLLAAAFLQAGLSIELKAVLYGAWDARDESVNPPRTPMFDLSPMVGLLNWANAAQHFRRTGDSKDLAALIKDQKKQVALSKSKDAHQQAQSLNNFAGALEDISRSLRLIRPVDAVTAITGLPIRLQKAKPVFTDVLELRPFRLLLDRVHHSYADMALDEPVKQASPWSMIAVQRKMLHWYFEHEQWVQSVTLAREWMVSWALACMKGSKLSFDELQRRDLRQQVSNAINAGAKEWVRAKQAKLPFQPLFLGDIPKLETVMDLWKGLSDLRNDLDHAGMRYDPRKAKDMINQLAKFLKQLESLPLG